MFAAPVAGGAFYNWLVDVVYKNGTAIWPDLGNKFIINVAERVVEKYLNKPGGRDYTDFLILDTEESLDELREHTRFDYVDERLLKPDAKSEILLDLAVVVEEEKEIGKLPEKKKRCCTQGCGHSGPRTGSKMPKVTKKRATGRRKMVKEINPEKYLGARTANVAKPQLNLDVPASAECLNINVIPAKYWRKWYDIDSHTWKYAGQTKTGVMNYGDTFVYKFPEDDCCGRNSVINQHTKMKTHRIYDVDLDIQPRHNKPVQDVPMASADLVAPTSGEVGFSSEEWIMRTGANNKVRLKTSGNNLTDSDTDDISNEPLRDWKTDALTQRYITREETGIDKAWDEYQRTLFGNTGMYYVISKRKQKLLGDWIQKIADGSPLNLETGMSMPRITPWLFDKFCHDVKPMFAKYMEWVPLSQTFVNTMKFNHNNKSKPSEPQHPTVPGVKILKNIPDLASVVQTEGEWRGREFHLHQDFDNLAPCDTYANALLFGSLGTNFMAGVESAILKVYHKEETVDAATLFFQENSNFQNVTTKYRGSRVEYGENDWGQSASNGIPVNFHTLVDHSFRGVVTCNHGEVEFWNNGEENVTGENLNTLQQKAEADTWY